jgi:hypothetical protein
MAKDFVPDSFQNLYDWANQLYTDIATQGPAAGWTAAQVTAFQALVAPIRDAAKDVLDKIDALDVSKGALQAALNANLGPLRQQIRNLKSMGGYTDGMGKSLGVHTPSSAADPNTYQPEIAAEAFPGHVRITGRKRMADSLNIYERLKGQTQWRLVATKRTRFPFDDDAPLAQAGVAETREYMAMGVIGDEEIGQPSDIVSVLYGG